MDPAWTLSSKPWAHTLRPFRDPGAWRALPHCLPRRRLSAPGATFRSRGRGDEWRSNLGALGRVEACGEVEDVVDESWIGQDAQVALA